MPRILDILGCMINIRILHMIYFFLVNKNYVINSSWCELFINFVFVLLIVLSFISDIFYHLMMIFVIIESLIL